MGARTVKPAGHTARVKIRGLCLVKNEADVIAQSLSAAAAWCDAVYVWDNGSSDDTWEIVQEVARAQPAVIPERRDSRAYSGALRRELFADHRSDGEVGDWWCLLDADELYIDDPRSFLADVPRAFDEVWAASFEYYFTEKDAARFDEDPSAYADDVPVEQKLRFYLNNWSEPRFFRLTKRLKWDEGAWPQDLGPAYPRRIRLKHFQYRSPQQIARRLATRAEPIERGHFPHEGLPHWRAAILDAGTADYRTSSPEHAALGWRDRILDSSTLIEDVPGADYLVVEDALPAIPPARAAWVRWIRRRARPLKPLLRKLANR